MSNKLTSLSERVDGLNSKEGFEVQSISHQHSERTRRYYDIVKYNDFLKTDLLSNYFENGFEYHFLNRFIPVDLEGNVLTHWNQIPRTSQTNYEALNEYEIKYNDHLSKVWFEGFEVRFNGSKSTVLSLNGVDKMYLWKFGKEGFTNMKSIKDLTSLNLNLTPFAAKLAGL